MFLTSLGTLLRNGWQHLRVAAGAIAVGTLYLTPEGNIAVFQGQKPAVAGDRAAYDNQEIYKITKGAIAFTAGDKVYFDGTDIKATGLVLVGRCVEDASSGAAYVAVRLYPYVMGANYTAVAASSAVTNTTDETTFSTGSVTIPANVLKVGDIIRVRAQAIATATNSTDTLDIKLKLGSTVILATGAVNATDNDIAYIESDIVIRTIGASGTLVAAGVTANGVVGTATALPRLLASTAVDTTAALAVAITATWSVASASNSCRLDVLNVQLIKA